MGLTSVSRVQDTTVCPGCGLNLGEVCLMLLERDQDGLETENHALARRLGLAYCPPIRRYHGDMIIYDTRTHVYRPRIVTDAQVSDLFPEEARP